MLFNPVKYSFYLVIPSLLISASLSGQPGKSGADSISNGQTEGRKAYMEDSAKNNDEKSLDRLLDSKFVKFFLRDSAEISSGQNVFRTGLAIYNGRPVRSIIIRNVDIFAPSVNDTDFTSESKVEAVIKKLHTATRQKVIRRNLLISEGDTIDEKLLTENEVLIRKLPYIMDARFVIRIIPDSDSVDLELLVKDLLPAGASGSMNGLGYGNVSLWHRNIFGIGHSLGATLFWDSYHEPLIGYEFFYGIPNLGGTFISAVADYAHTFHDNSVTLGFSRDFKTTGLKYAGAANFEKITRIRNIDLIDTSFNDVQSTFTYADIWVGRVFRLKIEDRKQPFFLYASSRTVFKNFRQGPAVSENYLSEFHDKSQLLFSLALARQSFRRDNYIYAFDRTEDVPSGILMGIVSGYEWDQFKERVYFSGSFSTGSYIPSFGYFHGTFSYSTFFYRGIAEQTQFNLRLRYFTNYFDTRLFGFRGFATINYQKIMNQYQGDYITLENSNGISGLKGTELRGDEKYLLNFETDFFNSHKLLGFRSVLFLSADLGLIRNHKLITLSDRFFSGIGIGIRIRNDQLVFNTFELKFSYFPGNVYGADPVSLNAGGVTGLRLDDFFPGRPETTKF
jgi:hypothetical protein